ncbi:MAG: enoyl-CoA hydratase/isomerase family protein [Paracoccaceae bacterium]
MIIAARQGNIGRITLNRPAAHNALTRDAMAEIVAQLQAWQGTEQGTGQGTGLRAIILTGTGKSFCAGASLDDVANSDWAENPLTALCDALEDFPAPVIAALNGGAYGGGVELALAADFRIGVTGMRAFVPPAKLGIHYEPAGIARAVARLGSQMARRMFLMAETFEDSALLAAGFLEDLVAPDALAGRATAMAEHIAGLAPMAVQGMKRTIVEIERGTLDKAAAKARIAAAFASADHIEGLAAQREKRPPKFSGA